MSSPRSGGGQPSNLVAKVNIVMDLVSLKVIFLLHFLVIVLALSCLSWMPPIYTYYNTFFFALLFWAIHTKERLIEPILMAAGIDLTAIALDIICIFSTYEYANSHRYWYPFSLAFIILNIVMRPFTGFVLVRLYFAKLNRYEMSIQEGQARGPSNLANAIRKVLLLDPMSGDSPNRGVGVDPNGTYRAHVPVERKTSAPLTSVTTTTTVPIMPPVTPSTPKPSSSHYVQMQIAHPQSEQPEPQPQAQLPPQQSQPPTPQPRRSSDLTQKQQAPAQSSPKLERGHHPQLPTFQSLSQSLTLPKVPDSQLPDSPQSSIHRIHSEEDDASSSSSDEEPSVPEPSSKAELQQQNRRSQYTDPSTGETFQERMI